MKIYKEGFFFDSGTKKIVLLPIQTGCHHNQNRIEFPLIIPLETNEWHFQRAILNSFNMSPHMTMLGHPSHKVYTVVVVVVVGQHHT